MDDQRAKQPFWCSGLCDESDHFGGWNMMKSGKSPNVVAWWNKQLIWDEISCVHHKFLVEIASIPIFLRNQFYFYDVISIFHRDSPLTSSIHQKKKTILASPPYLQLPTSHQLPSAPHIPFHLQEDSPRIANLRHPTDGSVQTGLALQSYESGPGDFTGEKPWQPWGPLRSTSMGGKNGDFMIEKMIYGDLMVI